MIGVTFRAWHRPEKKMYYRAYQKWFHILLCDDDRGSNGGKGLPAKRASFDDCDLLQSTKLVDARGDEVFEGDVVRVTYADKMVVGEVSDIPDMYKSRKLHPLHALLEKVGIPDKADGIQIEILGNVYQRTGEGKQNP